MWYLPFLSGVKGEIRPFSPRLYLGSWGTIGHGHRAIDCKACFGQPRYSGSALSSLFFASGIIPYLFFQTSISQSLTVIENNLALMNYRVVKPADPVVAKCILEMVIYCGTGVIILGGLVRYWIHI